MAIAFVQKKTGQGLGVNTFALTFDSNVTAGNFLVAQYTVYTGGSDPSNVTPTGGGTWNTTTPPSAVGMESNTFLCYLMNATGGATTVTVDYGTGFYIEGCISEFSGVATTSALDVQTTNSGTSTTPTSGTTGTTSVAGELVIAGVIVPEYANPVSLDVPATTGYTNLHVQQNGVDSLGTSFDYKIVSATGTQSAAWGTVAGNYRWWGKIATFKESSGGGDVSTALTGSAVAASRGTVVPASAIGVAGSAVTVGRGTAIPSISVPL